MINRFGNLEKQAASLNGSCSFSPNLVILLLVTGFAIYTLTDEEYFFYRLQDAHAIKHIEFSSWLTMLAMITSLALGVHLGKKFPSFVTFDPLDLTDLIYLRRICLISSLILLLSTTWVFVGNISFSEVISRRNELRIIFMGHAGKINFLLFPLQHFVYLWAAIAPKLPKFKWDFLFIALITVIIGYLMQTRLLVLFASLVYAINYLKFRGADKRILIIISALVTLFCGLTLIRVSGDSSVIATITDEILKYFITPYSYASSIIFEDLVDPEFGFHVIFSFFTVSIGKFFGYSFGGEPNFFMSSVFYNPSHTHWGLLGQLYAGFGSFSFVLSMILGFVIGSSYSGYKMGSYVQSLMYPIIFVFSLDFVRHTSIVIGAVPTVASFLMMYVTLKRLLR